MSVALDVGVLTVPPNRQPHSPRNNLRRGRSHRLALTALAAALLALGGCVETDGEPILHEVQESTCPGGADKRQPVNPDVIKAFYPCCDGRAHLIPAYLVPKDFHAMLDKGTDGESLCVPDEFAIDPDYTPKPCKSLFGQTGACISTCVPQVRDAPTPLPQDICAPGEKCAPCIDPRTNQETGACKMGQMACQPPPNHGKGTDQCRDWDPEPSLVNQYPVCCPGARCVPKEMVPDNLAKDLSACSGGYCVPEKFLARGGKYTPKTCRAIGGGEGRCLSKCIKSVASQADQLKQAECDPGEVCAPCYDPRTGMGTGACTAGHCDTGPKEPPKLFKDCGEKPGQAYCIPADLVPANDRCQFDRQGCQKTSVCEAGSICVPRAIMDAGPTYQPKKCKASLIGFLAGIQKFFGGDIIGAIRAINTYKEGRCLSKCLPQLRSDAKMLSQSGCAEGEVCAPCYDPRKVAQGLVPTGACDTNRRCPSR